MTQDEVFLAQVKMLVHTARLDLEEVEGYCEQIEDTELFQQAQDLIGDL